MKKVVFSEGKNDTEYLKHLINNHSSQLLIDRLDIESKPADPRIAHESNKLRMFLQSRNQNHILVKSEGGVPNLKETFSSLLTNLAKMRCDFYLLIDLDDGTMSDIVEDLNTRLAGYHPSDDLQLNPISDLNRRTHICIQEFEFLINGQSTTEFNIIAFRQSLESSANINKDIDEREEIKDKCQRLAENRRVSEPIRRVIFG